ncbi:LysR family transcriptional regulator [Desulfovibrio desulfuricans]|uniref:LysR family transcriptional regulator n=1 Tax=Desulfovibrio desulfuricans TaxID=876 RepID=A0A4P7UJR4_DESDE|nr:LysR family transcriptional regulator [Desulfovibrio desulfuricans]QCC86399.1 LysR family transcriptional regulator [Desulfovibrio desulfuricans]
MEIKHLKTLMMVASTRSISKASNQLHLSQPSVTRIIQEIESIVGVPLFSRTKNGMVLTGAGKNFYTQATRIVSTLHDVVAELKAPYESNIINIGFCPSVLIFDFIEQLRYSNYRMDYIRFHELSEKRQFLALANKYIDISIARSLNTGSKMGLEQIILNKAELFAVIPASHRLSGKKMISLDELKNDPFVALSEKSFPAYSNNIVKLCKKSGFTPNITFQANGYIAALATISAGACVGIFPRNIVNSIVPGYVYVPIHSNKDFFDISCYIRKNETRVEILDLVAKVQEQFRSR